MTLWNSDAMTKETISHAVYDGRELAGSITIGEKGYIALDAVGKRLGVFQTRIDAVKAVLAAPDVINRDDEAELIAGVERFMKGDSA
jgi:hypothetical protein